MPFFITKFKHGQICCLRSKYISINSSNVPIIQGGDLEMQKSAIKQPYGCFLCKNRPKKTIWLFFDLRSKYNVIDNLMRNY